MSNLLEGITPKTTKADLMDRLRKGARKLAGYEDERVGRMQEIEERVRATHKSPDDLRQLIVLATNDEWKETLEFLNEFEDCLPSPLARFREGVRVLASEEGIEIKEKEDAKA